MEAGYENIPEVKDFEGKRGLGACREQIETKREESSTRIEH